MLQDDPSSSPVLNRRPLRVRDWRVMQELARRCANWGIKPNQVSLSSIAGAAVAGLGMILLSISSSFFGVVFFTLVAVAGIGFRITANLIDGMIAVEGGFRTRSGEIFNDMPDRISDTIIFVVLGYCCPFPVLGWCAAWASVMTAYVRLLGGACGLKQDFSGPMAKPHRMAVTVVAVLALAAERLHGGAANLSVILGLLVITIGSVLTISGRIRCIIKGLECQQA
jgi:phosphatidylglycerophosphate synthase